MGPEGCAARASRGPPTATVLHADLDAFYASVEQLLDPSLRHRPVAVGGGVVLAASYEARAFGVASGMPGWRARQLCPAITFVPGHFAEYRRLGDQVMKILGDFTPLVERVSIDEAFLDVRGALNLFGPPRDIALAIRWRAREEVGLPLSVGVARTKHLAKVASQVAKPDGLVVVDPKHEREFLDGLPVGLIWGVGPATYARLASVGIRTIGELAAARGSLLEQLLGRALGEKVSALAANVDPRQIGHSRPASSIGAQAALGRRLATPELLRSALGYLADRVATRLRASHQAARRVTVRARFPGLRSVTRSLTLPTAVCETLTLTEVASGLASAALADHREEREVTLLGISASHLVGPTVQLSLPFPLDRPTGLKLGHATTSVARSELDRSVDAVRARFGHNAIGYATTVFSNISHVPEEFRELAQH